MIVNWPVGGGYSTSKSLGPALLLSCGVSYYYQVFVRVLQLSPAGILFEFQAQFSFLALLRSLHHLLIPSFLCWCRVSQVNPARIAIIPRLPRSLVVVVPWLGFCDDWSTDGFGVHRSLRSSIVACGGVWIGRQNQDR